jgi:hypothetical protein
VGREGGAAAINALLPLLIILSSALASLGIFFLSDRRGRLRTTLYLGGEVVKLALVLIMLWGIYIGEEYELRVPVLPGIDFLLRANALSMLFLTLSAGLWLVTTLYAIGYLRDAPRRTRFYGFFGLSVSATAGIALAGNLFTFLISAASHASLETVPPNAWYLRYFELSTITKPGFWRRVSTTEGSVNFWVVMGHFPSWIGSTADHRAGSFVKVVRLKPGSDYSAAGFASGSAYSSSEQISSNSSTRGIGLPARSASNCSGVITTWLNVLRTN